MACYKMVRRITIKNYKTVSCGTAHDATVHCYRTVHRCKNGLVLKLHVYMNESIEQLGGKHCLTYLKRLARLLPQQTPITVHRLLTKGNKHPFSVSVCRKNGRLPFLFSASSVFRIYIYVDTCAAISNRDFPYSVYRLVIVNTEFCYLSLCLRRNKRKLSVCKRTKQTKWTCPSMRSLNP
jgi:hypothetical protein